MASTKVKSAVSLETKFHAIQDVKDKKNSYSLVMQHFDSGVKHGLFDMTWKIQMDQKTR